MKMGFGVTMGGEKGNGGVKWEKDNGRLDHKIFTHLKDERFGGKDGGKDWLSFREDILVALGSADKQLEAAVKEVTDLKKKVSAPDQSEAAVGDEVWDKYSGELFARLLEITKEDAQQLVKGEGQKSGRCVFGP